MQKVVHFGLQRRKPALASFTLVELLIVMAIIALLAALTLIAAHGVLEAASRSRAHTEIQGIGSALENYKLDNSAYPATASLGSPMTTNNYATADAGNTPGASYQASSQLLFQDLAGRTNYTDAPVVGVKTYISFKTSQLGNYKTASSGPTYIQDPWGFSYGYSSGTGGGGPTTNYPYNGNGFFDLWSTGGAVGTGTGAGSITNTNAWISNWQ